MNRYSETLTLTLPYSESMAAICAKIGKAFDPDSGGESSFVHDANANTLVCKTLCVPEFKDQAQVMLGNAAVLHGACAQDYATRWADLVPPTLTECEQFLSVLEVA